MVVGLASLSLAGTSDSINLLVTPVTEVSVSIIQGSYNYTSVDLYNGTTVNTTAITVQNDGNVQASWDHSAGDATAGASTWGLVFAGTEASTDEFRLWAEVAASQPGTFPESDKVESSDTTLTGGGAVPIDETRNLWIKLEMPWAVTGAEGNSEHTCVYTITATAD